MYSRQVVWRERHTSRQGGKQKEGKNKGEVERREQNLGVGEKGGSKSCEQFGMDRALLHLSRCS